VFVARLFLVNPPTDETVRTPLLSFLYLASALRRAGHEVAVLDASAPFAPKQSAAIVEHVLAWHPTIIGIHCKTLYAQDAYALAQAFSGQGVPLVCGGRTRRSRRSSRWRTGSTYPFAARAKRPWSSSATLAAFRDRTGQCAFSFFDDSFAVGRRRMLELCAALEPLRVHWTAPLIPRTSIGTSSSACGRRLRGRGHRNGERRSLHAAAQSARA